MKLNNDDDKIFGFILENVSNIPELKDNKFNNWKHAIKAYINSRDALKSIVAKIISHCAISMPNITYDPPDLCMFAYCDQEDFSIMIETEETIFYKEFAISRSKLHSIITPHIFNFMNTRYTTDIEKILISANTLSNILIYGEIPKSDFEFDCFGIKIIYKPELLNDVLIL